MSYRILIITGQFTLITLMTWVGAKDLRAQAFDNVQPTGAAASMGEVSRGANVDPSTGTVNYSVPLLTVSDGSASVSLMANYASEGNKLYDPGGIIGYGWHLSVGGIITREVRGIPDDDVNGWWADGTINPNSESEAQLAYDGNRDAAPDSYRFQAGGYSGTFVFDYHSREILQVPQTDCEIYPTWRGNRSYGSQHVDGFVVITPVGMRYTYGGGRSTPTGWDNQLSTFAKFENATGWWNESTYGQRIPDKYYPVSFLLNNIESPVHGRLEYKYAGSYQQRQTYDEYQYSYVALCGQVCTDPNDVNCRPTRYDNPARITYEIELNSIHSKGEEITFTYEAFDNSLDTRILTNIEKNVGEYGQNVTFRYDKFESIDRPNELKSNGGANKTKKPALARIVPHGTSLSSREADPPHYAFEYNSLTGLQYAGSTESSENSQLFYDYTDYMGYAKSEANKWFGIPRGISKCGGLYGEGDRDPSHVESEKTLLKKVTNPYGGTSVISYEPHDYSTYEYSVATANYTCFDCTPYSVTAPAEIESFQLIDERSFEGAFVEYKGAWRKGNYDAELRLYVEVRKASSGGAWYGTSVSLEEGGEQTQQNITLKQFMDDAYGGNNYSMGYYDMRIRTALMACYQPNNSDCDVRYIKAEARIEAAGARFTVEAPGSRVASVTASDGTNSAETLYSYEIDDSNDDISSGVAAARPYFYDTFGEAALFDGDAGGVVIQEPSVGVLTFYTGNHIRYLRTEERTLGLGKVVRKFSRSDDPSSPVLANATRSMRRYVRGHGILERQALYADGQSEPYSITTYDYHDSYDAGNYNLPAYRVHLIWQRNENDQWTPNPVAYRYNTPRTIRPRIMTTTQKLDNRTTTTSIEYETTFKGGVAGEVSVDLPDGTNKTTVTAYTVDYTPDGATQDYLINANRIAIPWRTYTYKNVDEFLGAEQTEYGFFPAGGGNIRTFGSGLDFIMPWREKFWSHLTAANDWSDISSKSLTRSRYKVLRTDGEGRPTKVENYGEDLPTYYTYNSNDLLYRKTYGAAITEFSYAYRQLKTIIDASGITSTREYDEHNRLEAVEGCDGFKEEYIYPSLPITATDGGYYNVSIRSRATSSGKWQTSLRILNGMGREIQTINVGESSQSATAGANGEGAVFTRTKYDMFGRVARRYAPITGGSYVYGAGYYLYTMPSDARYTDYLHEASPRGRTLTKTLNNGFTTSYSYSYSDASSQSGQSVPSSFADNGLSQTTVTDAGGQEFRVKSDSWGNKIEEITLNRNTGYANAHIVRYEYDIQNQLRRVIPYTEGLYAAGQVYQYDYDHLGRVREKVSPGTAPERFYYNRQGRLVAKSDYHTRNHDDGERHWSFQYNAYGEQVKIGLNVGDIGPVNGIEEPLIEDTYDYTPGTVSFGQMTAHRTRTLETNQWIEDSYEFNSGIDPCGRLTRRESESTISLMNGSTTIVEDLSYDSEGNLNQSHKVWSANSHSIIEISRPKYTADLAFDRLDYQLNVGPVNGIPTERYDGNLHGVEYDKHGALFQKLLDRDDNSTSWLQHIDYSYDDIGRLTAINQPLVGSTKKLLSGDRYSATTNEPQANTYIHKGYDQADRDIFFESISYTTRQSGVSSAFTPSSQLHVGLIRQTVKQTQGRRPVVESYDYDGHQRLTRYEARETYAADGNLYNGQTNVHAEATYAYDEYSRPTEFTRKSWRSYGPTAPMAYVEVDDLNYDYVQPSGAPPGPQVRRITDSYDSNHLIEGHKAASPDHDDRYVYNDNGDIIQDPYRGIWYEYNVLGLVRKIGPSDGSGARIRYFYTADGQLREHNRREGSNTLVENIHYADGARIDLISDEIYLPNDVGAMLIAADLSVRPTFYHSDHIGNIMMAYHDADDDGVIDTSSELLEESRYYPYGMKLRPYRGYQTQDLPFGFNGAEELEAFSNLHVTTFRTMAPETGLWGQVDPKAEANYSMSPYSSMNGNPITYADPEGDIALQFLGGFVRGLVNGDNPFREGANNVGRMFEIGAGLFATDNSLTPLGQAGQLLSRFTWELPQTLSGQGLAQLSNTIGVVDNVDIFRGATVVSSGIANGAYTLGNVITGPPGIRGNFRDHLFVHEFGHVLQSRRMGPAYFLGVAFPSFTDATFETIGERLGLNLGAHDERSYEARASRLAADYFDREFGAGQPGYTVGNPNFFDQRSYIAGGRTPYVNPRTGFARQGGSPIEPRFHWTDIPYSLMFNGGLGLFGHL